MSEKQIKEIVLRVEAIKESVLNNEHHQPGGVVVYNLKALLKYIDDARE